MDKKYKSFFCKTIKKIQHQFPLSGRNPLDRPLPWDCRPGAAAPVGTVKEVKHYERTHDF